jgi:hypothetical protein
MNDKELELLEVGGMESALRAAVRSDSVLDITCDRPWSGDTESGFGREVTIDLTKEQARELAAFLLAWAERA